VLETLCLLVDLIPRDAENVGQETLDQAMRPTISPAWRSPASVKLMTLSEPA